MCVCCVNLNKSGNNISFPIIRKLIYGTNSSVSNMLYPFREITKTRTVMHASLHHTQRGLSLQRVMVYGPMLSDFVKTLKGGRGCVCVSV